mmetsp:Transcript_15028/g.38220  ORF Transcript_15028/g.38220 Transcript_15028/m.38220 type:complete len:85 (+) Transcript_15028:233-487(+)
MNELTAEKPNRAADASGCFRFDQAVLDAVRTVRQGLLTEHTPTDSASDAGDGESEEAKREAKVRQRCMKQIKVLLNAAASKKLE